MKNKEEVIKKLNEFKSRLRDRDIDSNPRKKEWMMTRIEALEWVVE